MSESGLRGPVRASGGRCVITIVATAGMHGDPGSTNLIRVIRVE